jgi:hypothetical protein
MQVGGLCALLTHASLTPYLSGVPWRHRAAQGLAALTAASSLVYGAHALPTTRLAPPPAHPSPPGPTTLRSPEAAERAPLALSRTRRPPLALSRHRHGAIGMLGERYASVALVLPAVGFVATACGLGVGNVMVPLPLLSSAPPRAPSRPLAPPSHPLAPLPLCRLRCSHVQSPRRPSVP